MKLVTKVYGILVNDKDEILLKRDDFSLPGGDIVVGRNLIDSLKKIVMDKTNILLMDVILFDELSEIDSDHLLGIFYVGTFKKEDIPKINQEYGWYKIKKLDINKINSFTKYIVNQIIN